MDKKKYTCIIVEDEKDYQEILIHYLNKTGSFEILGVYPDTVAATLAIERKKPEVIFLDINISGLEGPEFVELLDHQPKIIIVSGHSEDFMKAHYEVPYRAYIQKPVDAEKLRKAIEKL